MFALFCEDCGDLFVVYLDDDDEVFIGCGCSADPLDVFMADLEAIEDDLEVVDPDDPDKPKEDRSFY